MPAIDDFEAMRKAPAAAAVWRELSRTERELIVFRFLEGIDQPWTMVTVHPDLVRNGTRYLYFSIELGIAELLCVMPADGGAMGIVAMSVDRTALSVAMCVSPAPN